MKFCNTLIAVKDMEQSLQFYKNLFGQKVTLDLGWCKTLTCGLVLHSHFDKITGLSADTMKYGSNTMELYFETENLDKFIALLDKYPNVKRLHEPQTYGCQQKGIHIYDPNGHLIEVSENMYPADRKYSGKKSEDNMSTKIWALKKLGDICH